MRLKSNDLSFDINMNKPSINQSIALFVIASQLGFASTSVLAAVNIPPLTMSAHLGAAEPVASQDIVAKQDKVTKKDKATKKTVKPAVPIKENQSNQTLVNESQANTSQQNEKQQSLLDIYHQALAHDPTLASALSGNRAAQEIIEQGKALYLPTVNFNASANTTQSDIRYLNRHFGLRELQSSD
jgi:hypothetical protein